MMIDYKKEYELSVEKDMERKIQTTNGLLTEVIDSKKCIGFQIWLNNTIAEIVNSLDLENTDDIKKQDIRQFALAMQIFILNSKRLRNAFEMASTDSAESNYNLLRLIFESTMFSFYLYSHPAEIDEINQFFNDRFLFIDNPPKKRMKSKRIKNA